jgi:hypothetical protein
MNQVVQPHNRRWIVGVSALAVLALLALLFIPATRHQKWVGTAPLEVHVLVVDADSLEPIAKATVVVFDGPGYLEGRHRSWKPKDFLPDLNDKNTQQAVTDEQGWAVVTHRFRAHGTDGPRETTGWVMPGYTWVRISSPEHATVLLPLDGQTLRPRPLVDKLPIMVTVLVSNSAQQAVDTDDGP